MPKIVYEARHESWTCLRMLKVISKRKTNLQGVWVSIHSFHEKKIIVLCVRSV